MSPVVVNPVVAMASPVVAVVIIVVAMPKQRMTGKNII
jgi:hypothetical protein